MDDRNGGKLRLNALHYDDDDDEPIFPGVTKKVRLGLPNVNFCELFEQEFQHARCTSC